jgi:hypothetical protein
MFEKIIKIHRIPEPLFQVMASEHIAMRTRRYSKLLKCIFAAYDEDVEVEIDGRQYNQDDIAGLLRDWCTNRNIINTVNFSLQRNGIALFGFHDHPSQFVAALSERSFVQQLADEKIVRYRVLSAKPGAGAFATICKWICVPLVIVIAVPIAAVLLLARHCYRKLRAKRGHTDPHNGGVSSIE